MQKSLYNIAIATMLLLIPAAQKAYGNNCNSSLCYLDNGDSWKISYDYEHGPAVIFSHYNSEQVKINEIHGFNIHFTNIEYPSCEFLKKFENHLYAKCNTSYSSGPGEKFWKKDIYGLIDIKKGNHLSIKSVDLTINETDTINTKPTFSMVNAISFVKERDIVQGYDDGTYRPDNLINRAEFTKIITLATQDTESDNTSTSLSMTSNCFSDVSEEWFAAPVCTARQRGLINGYDDGEFKPANNINAAEMYKIVAKAFDVTLSTVEVNSEDVSSFDSAQDDTSPWYYKYEQSLKSINAIPSSITSPDKLVTRGEMAEIIFRVMTYEQ